MADTEPAYPIRREHRPGVTRVDWPGVFLFLGGDSDRRVYVGSHPMTVAAAREHAAFILAAADEMERSSDG